MTHEAFETEAWDAFRHGASLARIAAVLGVSATEADRWIDEACARNATRVRTREREARAVRIEQMASPTSTNDFHEWAAERERASHFSPHACMIRASVRKRAALIGVECPPWAALQRVKRERAP